MADASHSPQTAAASAAAAGTGAPSGGGDGADNAGSYTSDPVEIINPRGLHARASAALARLAAEQPCEIIISKSGESASATSLLDLLMLGAAQGDSVIVSATGPDALEACAPVVDLIKRGFDEI